MILFIVQSVCVYIVYFYFNNRIGILFYHKPYAYCTLCPKNNPIGLRNIANNLFIFIIIERLFSYTIEIYVH